MDGWDHAALRRKQLANNNMGQILQEVEDEERPEWKDIAAIYKSYWAQWNSLVVIDSVLEHHSQLADEGPRQPKQSFVRVR